jgi:hypothetical protein
MTGSPTISRPTILRLAFGALTALILLSVVPSLLAAGPNLGGYLDVDRSLYVHATERWLSGGPFYNPYQLTGPYPITPGDILYPPVALWLFVPFTFLPAAAWWAVPIGLTVWALWRLRPGIVVWPLLALCVVWPPTVVKIATGNPVMWVTAAVAVGVVSVGPAVFAFIKPSLFVFGLWGIRRRRWWIFLAIFLAMCVPFGTMWGEWLTTVINSVGGGLLYSVQEIPMVALGIVAWLGRTNRERMPAEPRHALAAVAPALAWILSMYVVLTFVLLVAQGFVADIWLKDYSLYMEATRSWLHGGPFYRPEQIAGPYDLTWGQILYPPVLLVLFVPSLVLPVLTWLVVPLAVTTIAMVAHRPSPVAWACVLGLIAMDPLQLLIYPAGNPTIWLVMAMALATHRPWVSAFILVKPSLTPFGLAGIRDRRWWAVVTGLAVVSLALWSLTLEWISAMRNLQDAGLFYALVNVQVMIIPIVAWLGRSRVGVAAVPEARRSWPRRLATAPDR